MTEYSHKYDLHYISLMEEAKEDAQQNAVIVKKATNADDDMMRAYFGRT